MNDCPKASALIDFENVKISESSFFRNTYILKINKLTIFLHQEKDSLKRMILEPDGREEYLSIIEEGMHNNVFEYISAECISKLSKKYLRDIWIYMIGKEVKNIEFRLNYFTRNESMMTISHDSKRSFLNFYFTPIDIDSKKIFLIETSEQVYQQAWIYEQLATTESLPGMQLIKADLSELELPDRELRLDGANKFYCILPNREKNSLFKDIVVFDKNIWPVNTSNPCIHAYQSEEDFEEDFNEKTSGLIKALNILEDADI